MRRKLMTLQMPATKDSLKVNSQHHQESSLPVWVLFIHPIEELQEAATHITGDGSHHAEIVVDQAPTVLSIHSNVARMWVCIQ